MVAPFTDLRDGDAESLVYNGLVGVYYQARSTYFSAYLSTYCFKSWKARCNYQNIIGMSIDLCQYTVHLKYKKIK